MSKLASEDENLKEIEALENTPEPGRSWRDPRVSLATFLAVAIMLALALVTVGHLLYINSSEYKLDLTRPGLKDIPKNDLVEVNRSQQYDSSSPIDRKAIEDEQKSMNSRLQELDRYGDFADEDVQVLQDAVLQGQTANN